MKPNNSQYSGQSLRKETQRNKIKQPKNSVLIEKQFDKSNILMKSKSHKFISFNADKQIQQARQKLQTIIQNQGIQTDLSQLLQSILQRKAINKVLLHLQNQMSYRNYNLLIKIINNQNFKRIVYDYHQIKNQIQQVNKQKYRNKNSSEFNQKKDISTYTIQPGLILRAKCKNQKCQDFNKFVCINKGFGSFQMGKILYQSLCPRCNLKTEKVDNFGYYKTNIEIEGEYDETGKPYFFKDLSLATYTDFKEGLHRQSKWSYLDIKTTPLKFRNDE